MGIFDAFRENKTRRISEQLGGIVIDTPNRKGMSTEAATSKTEVENEPLISKEVGERHPYNFSLYEQAYLQVPMIHGAINKTVDFALGPGFYVDCENKAAKKKIEKFMDEQDFESFLRIVTRNMLIYGSAFVEIIGEGKSIQQLKVLDPKNIYIKRDEHGAIEGYTQYLGKGTKGIDLTVDEIAYFPYNQIGEDVYGTSMLRPLFGGKISLLTQFLETEEAMRTIVKRRANTPIQVQVGTDEFPATAADVANVAAEMVDLTSQNEFVTSHAVNFNVLGYKGRLIDIRPFLDHYENNIIYGLEVPAVLLGRANVPEGLANVQMTAYERRITSLQTFIEKVLESQIFTRVVPNEDIEFNWGAPTPAQDDIEAMRLMNILKVPGLSIETQTEVENLLRRKVGLDRIDPKKMTYPTVVTPGAGGTPQDKQGDERKQNNQNGGSYGKPEDKAPPKKEK